MTELVNKIFKALGDETRLSIVLYLAKKKTASCKDVSEKFSDLSQPTMSHHFKILAEAEILNVEKNATERIYSLNLKTLKENGVDINKLL
jgi:DNA-binding transcriptional ArsR family regulator